MLLNYGYGKNFKSIVGRKEIKQRNFAGSVTELVVRSHEKNAESAKNIMQGITAGARKKGKPRMQLINDMKSVTGLTK